jgi:hypothetical protein
VTAASGPGARGAAHSARARRLRAPLLLALAVLLAFEALGGLVLFVVRLAHGTLPGETLHNLAGVALTAVYAAYQWRHWRRVRPWRGRVDDTLGVLAALAMALTLGTGLALGVTWWSHRGAGPAPYDTSLTALHAVGSMLVLSFVLAHVGAVLRRDPRALRGEPGGEPPPRS